MIDKMEPATESRMFKVCLVGDKDCCKTVIRRTRIGKGFTQSFYNTIGVDFAVNRMRIGGMNIAGQVWDLAPFERFSRLRKKFYKGASSCILVYDITNRKSFSSLQVWLEEIRSSSQSGMVPTMVIGHKVNLRTTDGNCVSAVEGEEFAKTLRAAFGFKVPFIELPLETEIVDGDELFDSAMRALYEDIIRWYVAFGDAS